MDEVAYQNFSLKIMMPAGNWRQYVLESTGLVNNLCCKHIADTEKQNLLRRFGHKGFSRSHIRTLSLRGRWWIYPVKGKLEILFPVLLKCNRFIPKR